MVGSQKREITLKNSLSSEPLYKRVNIKKNMFYMGKVLLFSLKKSIILKLFLIGDWLLNHFYRGKKVWR